MSDVGDLRGALDESLAIDRLEGGVVVIQIRSEPLGALNQRVKKALMALLAELEGDASARCLVLTGTGRAFSVGSDIREFERDSGWLSAAAEVDQATGLALEDSRLPVIAACNGLTFGGGAEVALACDIRIAAASARFGLPEVAVGAFASGGGTQRLAAAVGVGTALELLLTGRILEAEEARAIGLVQSVVDDEDLMPVAISMARTIASMPVAGIAATKRCVYAGLRHGRIAGHRLENELTVAVGLTDDAAEGQRAFIEKRAPRFGDGRGWIAASGVRSGGKG